MKVLNSLSTQLPGAKDPFPYADFGANDNKKNGNDLKTNIQFYVAVETTVNEKAMERRLRANVLNFARSVCVLAEDGRKSRGKFVSILQKKFLATH